MTDFTTTEVTHVVHREVTDPMLRDITVTYTWNSSGDGWPLEWHSRTKVTYRGEQISTDLPDWVTAFVEENRPTHVTAHHPRFTVAEAEKAEGCWLEGSRGWRITAHAVNSAASYGFPMDDDERAIVAHYIEGNPNLPVTLPSGEVVEADSIGELVTGQGGLSDRATEWLNGHIAPEGWAFGFHDGEYFLGRDEWWQDLD